MVERVSDGDTIIAFTNNQTKLHIQRLGIEDQEIPHGMKPGQPYGEEAWDYLDHLIGRGQSGWTPMAPTSTIASWRWSGMARSA